MAIYCPQLPSKALHSRDSLQLEYTDCLLDKNRLRKRIAELQANLEQLQRELEREQDRSREQMRQSSSCLNCVSRVETWDSLRLFSAATAFAVITTPVSLSPACVPSPTCPCAARTSATAPAVPSAWSSDLKWTTTVCCCGRSSMAFTVKICLLIGSGFFFVLHVASLLWELNILVVFCCSWCS